MLFIWTKQDKTCKFFRKSSFSSYIQQKNKQVIQLTLCLIWVNLHWGATKTGQDTEDGKLTWYWLGSLSKGWLVCHQDFAAWWAHLDILGTQVKKGRLSYKKDVAGWWSHLDHLGLTIMRVKVDWIIIKTGQDNILPGLLGLKGNQSQTGGVVCALRLQQVGFEVFGSKRRKVGCRCQKDFGEFCQFSLSTTKGLWCSGPQVSSMKCRNHVYLLLCHLSKPSRTLWLLILTAALM